MSGEQDEDEVTFHWTETVNRSMTVPASKVFDWLTERGYEIDRTPEAIGETFDDSSGVEDFVKENCRRDEVPDLDQRRVEEVVWVGWNGDHLRER